MRVEFKTEYMEYLYETPLDEIELPKIYFGYEINNKNERKLYMIRFDYK